MVRIAISIDVAKRPGSAAVHNQSDTTPPLRYGRGELAAQLAALDEEIRDLTTRWNLELGPIKLSRLWGTQAFAKLFILFSTLSCVAGAAMILLGGSLTELGTAVVVGATFSFSTFLNEVWSQGMNKQAQANQARLAQLSEQRIAVLRSLAS